MRVTAIAEAAVAKRTASESGRPSESECALAAERHHHVPYAARQQRVGRPLRTGRIGYGHSREHGALPAVGRKQVAAPQQLVGDRRRSGGIEDHPHAVPLGHKRSLAPGATTIEFSAAPSTQISATPDGTVASRVTWRTSNRSAR